MSIRQFGEKVAGYPVRVLNEREIRAAAGMLFVMMFIAINQVIFEWNFVPLKVASLVFFVDISIRLFVSPRWSPFMILGRWIVRNQTPEYVGAPQKQFAWIIGFLLSLVIVVSLVVLNVHSPVVGIICLICQVFLFFEAAFGICLGCWGYRLIYGKKVQYCPGEVCLPKDRQPIQKISAPQVALLFGFVVAVAALASVASTTFGETPRLIWGMERLE